MKRVISIFLTLFLIAGAFPLPKLGISMKAFAADTEMRFTQIAAGMNHSVALKEDGTVVAWGANYFGQCNIPDGLSGVKAIAAGRDHTLALKKDGTVVAWGNNEYGQCTTPDGLSGVKAIAGGMHHTVAIKEDDTVVAWGDNEYDQCTIPDGLSGVEAIAAGWWHTVALKKDGTVVAWGNNPGGECNVPTGLSAVKAIAAGGGQTVALKKDGTVATWGENYYGQCTTPDGLSNVKAISTGAYKILALKEDGTIVTWADNAYGKYYVKTDLSGVKAIAAGYWHNVVLKEDGTLAAWGENSSGQCNVPIVSTPTPEPNSVTPSEVTYDARKLPAFSVDLSTYNSLTDVKNEATSLIAEKDYTVSGSTLSIAPGYFNYYFNKFPNQDLKLLLYFSAGDSVTLTVHPFWEQIPVITPSEVKVDKTQITDVSITMEVYGNTLTSINNGTATLNPLYDYSISGNVVTIKKSYINYYFSKFPDQNLNIIFKFSDGYDRILTLYTGDSPNTVITPTVVTYKVGSKTDVAVTAIMNGNFFSSINNGTSQLVPRVDYTYAVDTNTLILRSSYMAYYFSKFNQDLVLIVNFTGGKPVTLTIKPVY
ncbi:MAG TPA: X2-like carbohydrate binding domain-containing protein [Clostridia bacterium]